MNSYMITWTYIGQRWLYDCDSERLAGAMAAMLTESGRTDVHVANVPYEETPEDSERKARVWARVQERIHNVPVVFQ